MKMNWLELFPEPIRSLLEQLPSTLLDRLEEIRIREGRPLEINAGGEHHFLTLGGKLTHRVEESYKPGGVETHRLLDRISNHSLYTMEEELRKGFITIPGGHRIGLAGRTVLSGGKVEHLRDISGFNVRIAREICGAADAILPHLIDKKEKRMKHTLILSPPQHGKTTLIRDIARQISSGSYGDSTVKGSGMKVGIIDERSEIAGSLRGVPSFDVGPRTDVMDGCPKAEGMMMMIRSMSPEVVIVDEVGRPEDVEAIIEALHAGISVIATAHGSSVDELSQRPAMAALMTNQLFERYVILNRSAGKPTYRILDRQQRSIQMSLPHQKGVDAYG
ncbi:stage III sporulation protein AA [Paenibacillus macquariensis]|uniref:Stage III sporulation protein AA n=1 Tax=Paenibacillus macquariensis TaxID=948756 RepID=A0ABY1JKL2_9BACL|nr:stage III sporulation protein AA [Paenibacillus macquariensis]MEC0089959.1 stage III sporulation protein AA [Paenibacillus macquariensis]OAB31152.1 stage III sporulation protein AA [Paenibacillus macquariensis subsp. macquariensis]SIQ35049.1 stage III sporulation protein AA [Paenibacillus macquariensis]